MRNLHSDYFHRVYVELCRFGKYFAFKSVNAQLVLVLVLHKLHTNFQHKLVQTTSKMFCPIHTKIYVTRYIITKHVF